MYIIGISVAAKKEWEAVLNKLNVSIDKCNTFPFGEYFKTNLYGEDIIFYRCGGRKNEEHLRDRLSERQIQNHVGDRRQQRPYKRIIKGLS